MRESALAGTAGVDHAGRKRHDAEKKAPATCVRARIRYGHQGGGGCCYLTDRVELQTFVKPRMLVISDFARLTRLKDSRTGDHGAIDDAHGLADRNRGCTGLRDRAERSIIHAYRHAVAIVFLHVLLDLVAG